MPAIDAVAVAHGLAEQSQTLEDLAAAIGGFELCDLRKGARNLVFGEGQTGCDVMIIGDVPGAKTIYTESLFGAIRAAIR